jgi:hypothetical protein
MDPDRLDAIVARLSAHLEKQKADADRARLKRSFRR